MTTPFVGEIQLFGFNFNPRGWAFCDGAMLPISQNTALFSLLGTTYGGDGKTTMQLPNFAGRAGCEQGRGPGLTLRRLGETFGNDQVTLSATQLAPHTHELNLFAQSDPAKRSAGPTPGSALSTPTGPNTTPFLPQGSANAQFNANMIANSGGPNAPHNNQQPYLAVNFCIALQGVYPSFQ